MEGWENIFGSGCILAKLDSALIPSSADEARVLLASLVHAEKVPAPPTAHETAMAQEGSDTVVGGDRGQRPMAVDETRRDDDDAAAEPHAAARASSSSSSPPRPADAWDWSGKAATASTANVLHVHMHRDPLHAEASTAVSRGGAEVWVVVPGQGGRRDGFCLGSVGDLASFNATTSYHGAGAEYQYRKKVARCFMDSAVAACGSDDIGKEVAAGAAAASAYLERKRYAEDNACYQAGTEDAAEAIQAHWSTKVNDLTKGCGMSYTQYAKVRAVMLMETKQQAASRAASNARQKTRAVCAALRGRGEDVVAAVEGCAAADKSIKAAPGSTDFIDDCSDLGVFRKAGRLLILRGIGLNNESRLGSEVKAAYREAKGVAKPAAAVRAKPVVLEAGRERGGKKALAAEVVMPCLPTVNSARQSIKSNRVGVVNSTNNGPVVTPKKLCAAMPIPSFIRDRRDAINAAVLEDIATRSAGTSITAAELGLLDMAAVVAASALPEALPQISGGLLVDYALREYMAGVTSLGRGSIVGSVLGMQMQDVLDMGPLDQTGEGTGPFLPVGGGFFFTDGQVRAFARQSRYYVGHELRVELSDGTTGTVTFRDPRAAMLYHLQSLAYDGAFFEPDPKGDVKTIELSEHEWTDGSTVARKGVVLIALCFEFSDELCRQENRAAFSRPFVVAASQNMKETKATHELMTQLYTSSRHLRFPKGDRILKVDGVCLFVCVFVCFCFSACSARTQTHFPTHTPCFQI